MEHVELSWERAWAELGLAVPSGVLAALLAAWGEAGRAYHTVQHLRECLAHFEAVRDSAARPGELAVALWFHDAVYALQGKENERLSADWAVESLAAAGAAAQVQARVRGLIMATCHTAVPTEPDAQLMVDIDLAILGAEPARFREYDEQVKLEYSWVPPDVYRVKRREVLQGFLSRPQIYSTPYFRERYEAQARANLGALLG